MAGETISGYRFAMSMDDGGITRTMRELRNEAKLLKSGMQANFAEIKSGEGVMAAYAQKVKDAGNAIQAQQAVIAKAKSEQNGLDMETQKGRESWVKYENQINSAKRTISSLEGQQQRAKQSLELQRSSVLQLKDATELASKANESYVARLKAEGKEADAEKVKLAGLRESHTNMVKQLNAEKTRLSEIASESGKTSNAYQQQIVRVNDLATKLAKNDTEWRKTVASTELASKANTTLVARLKAEGQEVEAQKVKLSGLREAYSGLSKEFATEKSKLADIASELGKGSSAYKNQEIKVNELGTKIAETNTKMHELDETLAKKPRTGLTSIIENLDKVNEKTEKANHLFGKVLGAQLVSNGLTAAWTAVTTHIKEAVVAGMEYEKEQQKMGATWQTLTGNTKSAQAMVNTINDLSIKTGQATDTVNELEQGFYHLHSNKKESDELTKSMLNMSDAVGLDSKQIQAVTQDMVNGLSRGKANAGMLNQISQYFPMFREQLAQYETQVNHGKKVTVSDLSEMARSGKISAKDIEAAFNELGSHKYNKAADNMLQTMVGMERTVKARVPALIGDIEKPIMSAENPIYGSVSKWVSDKRTDQEFTKVGVAAQKGIATITKAFSDAFGTGNATKSMDDAMDVLAVHVTNASNEIADNAPEIVDFFKTVKNLGGLGFQVLIESLKLTNSILRPLLGLVGNHTETVAKFGAAWLLTNKTVKAGNAVFKTFNSIIGAIKWASEKFGIDSTTKSIEAKTVALSEQNTVLKENAALAKADSETSAVGGVASGAGTAVKGAEEATEVAGSAGLLGKLKGLTTAGKGLTGATGLLSILAAGSDLIGTNKSNVGNHVGGAAGNLGGTAAGAAIGTAILPGIGTALGAGIGSIGGDKLGRLLGGQIQKGLSSKKLKVEPTIKLNPIAKKQFDSDMKDLTNPSRVSKATASMASSYNNMVSKINQSLKKANGKFKPIDGHTYQSDMASLDKADKKINTYYSDQEKEGKKNLKTLLDNGSISQKQYDKDVKALMSSNEKKRKSALANDNDMRKALTSYYNQVQKDTTTWNAKILRDEQTYGKNSKQVKADELAKKKALEKDAQKYGDAINKAEEKSNTALTKALKVSANNQLEIQKYLNDSKGKLSVKQRKEAIKDAAAESAGVINAAKKMRTSAVKEANTKYSQTVKAAKKEYQENGSISYKQYKEIIKNAQQTRNGVIKEADKKYKSAVSAAKKEYSQTVKAATQEETQIIKHYEALRKQAISKADDTYKKRVKAIDNEYKGTSDASKRERDQVLSHAEAQHKQAIEKANDTYKKRSKSATDEKNKITDEAEEQRKKVIAKADDQKNKTTADTEVQRKERSKSSDDEKTHVSKSAEDARKSVSKSADDQKSHVTKEAEEQRKTANDEADKTKTHEDSTWKSIKTTVGGWLNKIGKGFNASAKDQNTAFKQYGGFGSTISMMGLGYDRYATGTGLFSDIRKAITQPTMAMLNDGSDSPETGNQEIVFKHDGSMFLPQGRNWTGLLNPGDEVANATESKFLAPLLGLTHFAGGTGLLGGLAKWASGIFGALMSKVKAATSMFNNADKSWADTYNPDYSGLKGSAAQEWGKLNKKNLGKAGGAWWKEAWNQINGAINDTDASSGLLAAVEKYGKGKPYVWGATGPDSFDCSGLVMYSLKKAFNIIYPHFSGSQIAKAASISHSSLQPGDLIGNDEHIGVYAGGGKYWSAMSPSSHPNIGMSPVSTFPGTPKYGRVRGIPSTDITSKKKETGLAALVKKELGPGVFAYIKKFLAPLMESDGSETASGNPLPSGSHKNWLKQAGIPSDEYSMYTYIIDHESSWNPHATNPSSGAYGIPQSLPGSKMRSAGKDWKTNPITQLKWMKSYVNERYGGISGAYHYWQAHHNYEYGGLSATEKIAHISEGNKPEMIIPWDLSKRSRAYQLMAQTMQYFAGQDGIKAPASSDANGVSNEAFNELNAKFDTLLSMFSQLLGVNGQQLKAIKDGTFDKQKLYRQQAIDQTMYDNQVL